MNPLIKFFIFLDKMFAAIVDALLVMTLLAIVVLIAGQVFLRNLFEGGGIQWAELAARHLVLWIAFLGAMLATRSRQHIAIDAFMRFIPRIAKNSARIGLDAFACVITFLLAKASLAFVISEKEMGSIVFADVPTWVIQSIIPFGFAMISFEYAIGIGLDIYRIAQDKGHVAGKGRE